MKIKDIPQHAKDVLDALIKFDPEVAEVTINLSREPSVWLNEDHKNQQGAPICGCFLGTYAWQLAEKRGENLVPTGYSDGTNSPPVKLPNRQFPFEYLAEQTELDSDELYEFGVWAKFSEQDRAAAFYVGRKLREKAKALAV